MPILVTSKGILRSFIHAANLVKLLLASFERSCFSALMACPDRTRLIITFLLVGCSSHLMQCHAWEININVEGYVEVVGEDIQRNMSDDFGDLSIREALVAQRLYATRRHLPRFSNNSRANVSAAVSLDEVPCPWRLLRICWSVRPANL